MNTALQWMGASSGILAMVGVIISWPKTRGEGKKYEGEGKQAEGAGELSAANARVAEQVATLEQTRIEADRAHVAKQDAERARDECQAQKRQMHADFDAFVDVIEELVPLLPPGESQRKARVAIRAARLAI